MDPEESNVEPYEVENPKKIEVVDANLPICPVCRFELEAVRYTDYGDIRVVHHTSGRCVIGTITKP